MSVLTPIQHSQYTPGTTVTADPRRGTIKFIRGDDSLLHLQWTQRPNGELEPTNDLILFPGDAVWESVPECTTGRVFLLRFQSSNARRFFWMQEPDASKDAEFTKKINDHIAGTTDEDGDDDGDANSGDADGDTEMEDASGQSGDAPASGDNSGSGPSGSASGDAPNDAEAAPAPSSSAASSSSDASAAEAAMQGQFANLSPEQQMYLAAAMQRAQSVQSSTLLLNTLDADRLLPVLEADEQLASSLFEYLPEGQQNMDGLRRNLRSPQLRQTLARMGHVLSGEQAATVFLSFGVQPAGRGDTAALLDALQEKADKSKSS